MRNHDSVPPEVVGQYGWMNLALQYPLIYTVRSCTLAVTTSASGSSIGGVGSWAAGSAGGIGSSLFITSVMALRVDQHQPPDFCMPSGSVGRGQSQGDGGAHRAILALPESTVADFRARDHGQCI